MSYNQVKKVEAEGYTHVQSPGRNISADERALRGVAEFKECVRALLLLLLAVQI
jgi:hypothetical protein